MTKSKLYHDHAQPLANQLRDLVMKTVNRMDVQGMQNKQQVC